MPYTFKPPIEEAAIVEFEDIEKVRESARRLANDKLFQKITNVGDEDVVSLREDYVHYRMGKRQGIVDTQSLNQKADALAKQYGTIGEEVVRTIIRSVDAAVDVFLGKTTEGKFLGIPGV